jgi:hypothetical protein
MESTRTDRLKLIKDDVAVAMCAFNGPAPATFRVLVTFWQWRRVLSPLFHVFFPRHLPLLNYMVDLLALRSR